MNCSYGRVACVPITAQYPPSVQIQFIWGQKPGVTRNLTLMASHAVIGNPCYNSGSGIDTSTLSDRPAFYHSDVLSLQVVQNNTSLVISSNLLSICLMCNNVIRQCNRIHIS